MSMLKYRSFVLQGANARPFLCDLRWINNQQHKPVLIFAHGFKGFKDWGHFNLIANTLAHKGFVVIKFNFSHNGTTIEHPDEFVDLEAFGHNTYSKELFDLDVVITYVQTQEILQHIPSEEINTEQIGLIGHSRGGAIVLLQTAKDKRVKAVCTWAAVARLAHQWWDKATIEQWEKEGVLYVLNSRTGQKMPLYIDLLQDFRDNEERLNLERVAPQIEVPTLIVHGDKDESVPVEHAYLLHEWIPRSQCLIIEGANHTFGGRHPWKVDALPSASQTLVERTSAFFLQHLHL